MHGLTFRKKLSIHSYELDFEGFVKPISLVNLLQDVASAHAAHLQKKDMTWLLSRTHVRIRRYPVWPGRRPSESEEKAGPVVLHQIVNASTGAELKRLRTRWK